MTLTPYEHYVKADRLLGEAEDLMEQEYTEQARLKLMHAQVHATLALDSQVQIPRKNRGTTNA